SCGSSTVTTRSASSGSCSASQRSLVTVKLATGTDPTASAHFSGPPSSAISSVAAPADRVSFQSRAGRTTSPASSSATMPCCWPPTEIAATSSSRPPDEADSSAAAQTAGSISVTSGCGAEPDRTTCPVPASQTRTLVDWVEQSMPATRVLMRSILRHRAPARHSRAGPAPYPRRHRPATYPRRPRPATRPRPHRPATRPRRRPARAGTGRPPARAGAGRSTAGAGPAAYPRRTGRLHAQLGAGLVHERRGGGADRRVVPVDAGVEDQLPADPVLAGYAPTDHPDPAPHAGALGSGQRVVPGEGDRLLDPRADVLRNVPWLLEPYGARRLFDQHPATGVDRRDERQRVRPPDHLVDEVPRQPVGYAGQPEPERGRDHGAAGRRRPGHHPLVRVEPGDRLGWRLLPLAEQPHCAPIACSRSPRLNCSIATSSPNSRTCSSGSSIGLTRCSLDRSTLICRETPSSRSRASWLATYRSSGSPLVRGRSTASSVSADFA